jgi:anti-sigma28 factor (negative regulator of flagellin synthesis)
MRIENGNIGTVGGNTSSGAVHSAGTEHQSYIDAENSFSDTVSLSNASGLIALAKDTGSLDRQARVSTLTAEVRSGTYRFSADDVAQSILKQAAGAGR